MQSPTGSQAASRCLPSCPQRSPAALRRRSLQHIFLPAASSPPASAGCIRNQPREITRLLPNVPEWARGDKNHQPCVHLPVWYPHGCLHKAAFRYRARQERSRITAAAVYPGRHRRFKRSRSRFPEIVFGTSPGAPYFYADERNNLHGELKGV